MNLRNVVDVEKRNTVGRSVRVERGAKVIGFGVAQERERTAAAP